MCSTRWGDAIDGRIAVVSWRRLITWAVVLWINLAVVSSFAGAQQVEQMPWVDESGKLVPWALSQRGEAATNDRDSVALAPADVIPPPAITAKQNWDLGFLGRPLVYTVLGVGGTLFIGLIVWALVTGRFSIGDGDEEGSGHRRSLAESIQQLPFEVDANFGDFREQALAAYQAGDWRRSLILLFSHVLVTLDQREFVYLKKGKTNRQYLRELKGFPPLASYYGDLMVPFERAFFGDHAVEQAVCEKCWQDLDQFQSHVDSIKAIER